MDGRQLRQTFDGAAERYDLARPGYPSEMVDDLVAVAGLTEHSSILEIGCGTGQLTVPLARLGATVTAIELGARLAALARRNLADHPAVTVVTGAFEDLPPPERGHDLVVAATSFHWLDEATRVERCARALRPRGWLAVIDTLHVAGGTAGFFRDVQRCYEAWDPATPPGLRLLAVDEIPRVGRNSTTPPMSSRPNSGATAGRSPTPRPSTSSCS